MIYQTMFVFHWRTTKQEREGRGGEKKRERERDNSKNSIARSIEHILSFYICTLRESSLLATGLHRTNRLLSYYHGIVFSPLSLLASLFLLPTLFLRLSLCPLSLYPYPKTILCPSLLHLERYWKQAQRRSQLKCIGSCVHLLFSSNRARTFKDHSVGNQQYSALRTECFWFRGLEKLGSTLKCIDLARFKTALKKHRKPVLAPNPTSCYVAHRICILLLDEFLRKRYKSFNST